MAKKLKYASMRNKGAISKEEAMKEINAKDKKIIYRLGNKSTDKLLKGLYGRAADEKTKKKIRKRYKLFKSDKKKGAKKHIMVK